MRINHKTKIINSIQSNNLLIWNSCDCILCMKCMRYILTVLSFFHLWMRPNMPEVTDNSPSDGGFYHKIKTKIFFLLSFFSSKNQWLFMETPFHIIHSTVELLYIFIQNSRNETGAINMLRICIRFSTISHLLEWVKAFSFEFHVDLLDFDWNASKTFDLLFEIVSSA